MMGLNFMKRKAIKMFVKTTKGVYEFNDVRTTFVGYGFYECGEYVGEVVATSENAEKVY